jgi:hypothetical protein
MVASFPALLLEQLAFALPFATLNDLALKLHAGDMVAAEDSRS